MFGVALVAGVLLAGLVESHPVAAQTARAAAVVPDGIFTDLVKLDRKLAKLIHEVRTNGADHRTVYSIIDIHDAKLRMVDRYFDQPVYGLRFSEVFAQLDCLDSSLALANGVMTGVGTSHLGSKEDERVIRLLEQGKKCKQKLEDEFHKANQTSTGGSTGTLGAVIVSPRGNSTFMDGPIGGAMTSSVQFQGQIVRGSPPYTSTINWGDGSTATGTSGTHAYPAMTSLIDGKKPFSLGFSVRDSGGHTASTGTTITVLCGGISHPGFMADLGAGSMPTIVFCGHWTGGFVPAKVLYMPASGQSWQFNGTFNLFENHQTCPDPTSTQVGACQPKNQTENPTLHWGGAFNIDMPVASGIKITVEGEDTTGHVVQSFTGTVP